MGISKLVAALNNLNGAVQPKPSPIAKQLGATHNAKGNPVGAQGSTHIHGATGARGPVGPMSPLAQAAEPKRKPSDQRFRSFAERYLVSRSAFFRQDPIGMAEDTWSCILDAKRAYGMIERMGQNIQPEDDIF